MPLLINNAGCGYLGRMGETKTDLQTRMVDLNVRALTAVTNLVIPYMPAGAHILNTSSIASFCPNAPDDGVLAPPRRMCPPSPWDSARSCGAGSITVTAVCPGPMKTEFLDVGSIAGRSPGL